MKSLLVVIAILVSVNGICIPGQVPNITLLSNLTLTWSDALNPNNCTIVKYYVNILDTDDGSDLQFEVTDKLSLNVSFLDSCKYYYFEVHAFTKESDIGPSYRLYAKTSLPAVVDLSLSSGWSAAVGYYKFIEIYWDLRYPKLEKCISYYRVLYWDEINATPISTYVNTKQFKVSGNIPACITYTFQVNAIITDSNIEGPISNFPVNFIDGPTEPKLISLLTTNNSAQLEWQIESYSANRCNMLFLAASITGVPDDASYLQVPITDNISRPNVLLNITGLQPNSYYTTNVSVVNIDRASNNVTVSLKTDP